MKTKLVLITILLSLQLAFSSQFKIVEKNDTFKVQILSNESVCVSSPKEGLWSIALDWQNQWPANWQHAHPQKIEKVNGWTILSGELETPGGNFELRDSYLPYKDYVKCTRRFEWHGEDTLKNVTLTVRFSTPGKGKSVLLPGIQYYGNPSGEKSRNTPVYHGDLGEEIIYEEHRFPMPFACFEWDAPNGFAAALHSLPSPVPFGNVQDQWWSLGAIPTQNGSELVLYSGPCASNKMKSVIKAYQRNDKGGFAPYENIYLNIPPGSIIEKTFYLQAYSVEEEGTGFQQATRTSLEIFKPVATPDMPSMKELVLQKYIFSKTRWMESDNYAGFNKYDAHAHGNRRNIVLGWCGQAAAPGYAYQALREELDDPASLVRAQKSLDFVSTSEFYKSGFHTWYHVDKKRWQNGNHPEWLSQGQGMLNVAKAIELGKTTGLNSTKWKKFLQKACEFHSGRILKDDWKPQSTNEGFFIAPLCRASKIFNSQKFKKAAVKAGEVYANRHLSMQEPYWGGTLDASCEDKEGAFAALQGFLALYELTGEEKYLKWAEHAGDVALTYVYVDDIDLPAGRLRDHAFKTRGWTAVSVQNMHIDVYGVLIAPDIYKIGKYTDNDLLKQTAILMYRSCGQLMDAFGSQGEQPQQTNYAQGPDKEKPMHTFQGGYHESWTVFWITAHFLTAAADFAQMDVEF